MYIFLNYFFLLLVGGPRPVEIDQQGQPAIFEYMNDLPASRRVPSSWSLYLLQEPYLVAVTRLSCLQLIRERISRGERAFLFDSELNAYREVFFLPPASTGQGVFLIRCRSALRSTLKFCLQNQNCLFSTAAARFVH